jgi:uncharacterized protein (UPF0128 family)
VSTDLDQASGRNGERRDAYMVLVGKPEGKSHLEDLRIDGRIILKCIYKKWNGESD